MRNCITRILIITLFLMIACQKEEARVVDDLIPQKINVANALEAGEFKLVVDASLISIKITQEPSIPVQGSLNLHSGHLSLNNKERALDLIIDMESWDSDLTVRDNRVLDTLLVVAEPVNKTAKFKVGALPDGVVAQLKKDKKAGPFTVKGELEFAGAKVVVDAELKVLFNSKGRLMVRATRAVPIKLSELGLTEKLQNLIQTYNQKSIEDTVYIEYHLEFEPM